MRVQVDDVGLLLQGILECDGAPPENLECRPHRVLRDDCQVVEEHEFGMNIQGCQEAATGDAAGAPL